MLPAAVEKAGDLQNQQKLGRYSVVWGKGGAGGGGGLGGLGLGEGGSALLTSPLLLGDLSTQQSPYPVPRGPLARNAWSRDVIC